MASNIQWTQVSWMLFPEISKHYWKDVDGTRSHICRKRQSSWENVFRAREVTRPVYRQGYMSQLYLWATRVVYVKYRRKTKVLQILINDLVACKNNISFWVNSCTLHSADIVEITSKEKTYNWSWKCCLSWWHDVVKTLYSIVHF